MASYRDLLKQREELERQLAVVRQQEVSSALEQIHRLIAEFGITPEEVFPAKAAKLGRPTTSVAPKYRDPVSGNTWTGRGREPYWMRGKRKQQFLIEK